jgi:hypothetical protein
MTTPTDWPKGPYRWVEDGRWHISVPFTWNLLALRTELLSGDLFTDERPVVGGPAVMLRPEYLADVAEVRMSHPGVLQRVNPLATRTTVGCPNRCGFCAVPKIEGEFRELAEWPDLPVLCDNNLLAASVEHFDRVIDRLRRHQGVDFNQGLDARLLTVHHARRLAELDATIRLAWDHVNTERYLLQAVARLRQARIPRARIRCYVLIGYHDTPEDALYRLEVLRYGLGIDPNPMRYTPVDAMDREYVAPGWDEDTLTRFMRYWSNLRGTGGVPFEEFR